MSKFVLTLTNNINDIDLYFDIIDTPIAAKWAAEIDKKYPLYETERFKGWPNDGKDYAYYLENLSAQVRIVNNYRQSAIDLPDSEIAQNDLNHLHKFFEDLRGPINEGTEFYNNAPEEVKQAVDRFNVFIHEFEHYQRHKLYPEMVCTYSDRPRHELDSNDYEHFTFKWEFGCVYINYCEVGKPLLDVFKDQDSIVGDDNIRPLEYYSADFTIKFGPATPEIIYEQKLKAFNQWFANQGREFDHLSLGLIPVAKINLIDSGLDGLSELEIVTRLSDYLKVKETCIK